MLTSQGWQPGSSLGASDAAHAAHYTAASESHIRVLLKDDNLGLGAKRGSEQASNFGLAGLESILGRLNGKEEEVKKEEERREQVEQRAFVYRKYGFMNFVSAGFLVGDKIKTRDDIKKEPEVKVEVKTEPQSDDAAEDSMGRKRKRKEGEGFAAIAEGAEDQPKLKRKKKSMDLRDEVKKEILAELSKLKKDKTGRKGKSDKERKKSRRDKISTTSDPELMTSDAPSPASDPEPLTDKARRKVEKKARKEEKKLKKALRRAAKEAAKSTADDSSSESDDEKSTPTTSSATSVLPSGTSTPTLSAAGLTFSGRGMHAVRQRYIRQKRAATMDAQAMREIFMIKSTS
jgi:Pin2-interacting protein X1